MKITLIALDALSSLWVTQKVMPMRAIITDIQARQKIKHDPRKVYAALDLLQTLNYVACSWTTGAEARNQWGITPLGTQFMRNKIDQANKTRQT